MALVCAPALMKATAAAFKRAPNARRRLRTLTTEAVTRGPPGSHRTEPQHTDPRPSEAKPSKGAAALCTDGDERPRSHRTEPLPSEAFHQRKFASSATCVPVEVIVHTRGSWRPRSAGPGFLEAIDPSLDVLHGGPRCVPRILRRLELLLVVRADPLRAPPPTPARLPVAVEGRDLAGARDGHAGLPGPTKRA